MNIDKVEDMNDQFIIILEENCGDYRILTSINGLDYRVEVYKKNQLEDAIEVSCHELRNYPKSDILFEEQYSQAHKKFVEKICFSTVEKQEYQHSTLDDKVISHTEQPLTEAKWSLALASIKRHNKKIIVVFIFLVVLFKIISILICNENVIQFFTDPRSFYKKTESFCHKLEKKCVLLSKNNLNQVRDISPYDCRMWCENNIIKRERCARFLPYFSLPKAEKIQKNSNSLKIDNQKKQGNDISYTFMPQDTFTLMLEKSYKLQITNTGKRAFHIKLESLIVQNTNYEEIVQFQSGKTALSLRPGETGYFEVYLEPTYYEQFDNGEYRGSILFKIFDGKKKIETVKKKFVFRVE